MVMEGLTFIGGLQLFGYLFLPVLLLALFVFWSILLSNRMGGENFILVLFIRFILVGALVFGFFYYFYWLIRQIIFGA
jgi:hypothetical protein